MFRTSAGPIFALALVMSFLGIPASPASAEGCDTPGTPTRTAYLPNITKTLGGTDGWVTPFIVQNIGSTATTLEVAFYGFSDGALVTCRKVTGLQPGTSFADVPNNDVDLPGNSQFSVVIRSFGSDIVSVVNEHQGTGSRAEALSYVGLSSGATKVSLPYVPKQVGGWLTTFIMQNLGTTTATVTASFLSYDGTKTATLLRAIGPGGAGFVNPLVEPALIAGTEYSVTLTSNQPIAVVANAHNDDAGVVNPRGFSYNGVASPGPAQSYLPYIARNADGIGRTTRLLVQNAGSAAATPTLTFLRYGTTTGAVLVSAPAAIAPGATWALDVATSALTDGEYSATASGGDFAILAAALSTATAMSNTAIRDPLSRSYIPNVTRTLGGTQGWTTPIVVQSAGATGATLKWYRFEDGALVTTQTLSGLVAGASVRVDPRVVPALSESTQYAVVVDGIGGAIAALVTELNFQGGDGGMIYEGFPAVATLGPVLPGIPGGQPPATGPILVPSFVRYSLRVMDSVTGAPVVGACVYTGPPAGCPLAGSNRTDATGYTAVDLPGGIAWQFTVEHPSYVALLQKTLVEGVTGTFTMVRKP